jgi:hypothetical protein
MHLDRGVISSDGFDHHRDARGAVVRQVTSKHVSDDEFRESGVVQFSTDRREVRLGPRDRRLRHWIGGTIGVVCLAITILMALSQRPVGP